MLNNKQRRKIIRYYKNPESRWGYHHYLWGAKHFGYYPSKRDDISEQQAQINLQDLVAKNISLHKGQRCLDAGCGEGLVSSYLAQKTRAHITGVSIVPFEIKACIARAKQFRVSELTDYEVMDYTATDFSDESFDAVYTTESLSHIPDPRDALREFFRLLKPGGRLALFEYTLAPDVKFSPQEMKMLDLVIRQSGMYGLKKIRHEKLVDDITAAGFSHVKQQNISDHIKPSFARLNSSAIEPYRIISRLGLRRFFVNTTASVEYYKMAQKDLIRYYIFTAQKPPSK